MTEGRNNNPPCQIDNGMNLYIQELKKILLGLAGDS